MHQLPRHQFGSRITGQAHLDQPDLDLNPYTPSARNTKLFLPPGDPFKPTDRVRAYMPDPSIASDALWLTCGREVDFNEARTFQGSA